MSVINHLSNVWNFWLSWFVCLKVLVDLIYPLRLTLGKEEIYLSSSSKRSLSWSRRIIRLPWTTKGSWTWEGHVERNFSQSGMEREVWDKDEDFRKFWWTCIGPLRYEKMVKIFKKWKSTNSIWYFQYFLETSWHFLEISQYFHQILLIL